MKALAAILLAGALAALCACGKRPAADAAPGSAGPVEHTAPAGTYRLDPYHASLVFRIGHIGYSRYTASFEEFDATLEFNPDDPASMRVEATIDPRSLRLIRPPAGFYETLMEPDWFDARAFPEIMFRATKIEPTGPAAAHVVGEMTFLGVAAPLAFEARFNGGYAGMETLDPQARIGFSAYGTLSRSDWGFVEGLPPEGTNLGVGDEVEFFIEAEFLGPPLEAGRH